MTINALEQTDPFQPRERHLAIVSGGTSEESTTNMLAKDLANATSDQLSARGIVPRTHLIELRDLAAQAAQSTVTLARSEQLDQAIKNVEHADGIIAVTPTYQASYSGIFKTFWDLVDSEKMVGIPVMLGATGGTARHSLIIDQAMRPLFSYLKMLIAPTAVFAASEDWGQDGFTADGDAPLEQRIRKAGSEFAKLLSTTEARIQELTSETETELQVKPFSQLLKKH